MNQTKKTIKRVVLLLLVAVLVAGLAVMPFLATREEEEEITASILSGKAETGEIGSTIRGGGTLTQQEAVEVSIPSGVLLTEFLVSNGDTVAAGDEVALADRISVMSVIAQVQETLEYLNEQIEDAREAEVASTLKAPAGGKVKVVHAQAGDSVQDVMAEHGALAVLSLDGLMAVEINRSTDLVAGDSVLVQLPDDSEVTGWVESNIGGTLVITVTDLGYEPGQQVMVTTNDGDRVGAGSLYIHNAWYATAISGTVSRVYATVNAAVRAGGTLFTLKDTEYTAEFEQLCDRRREYEEVLLELFRLYQELAVVAQSDGVISGLDGDSAFLLRDRGSGYTLSLLANAPNGDDSQEYRNYLAKVSAVGSDSWALSVNTTCLEITDYKLLSEMEIDTAAMTELVLYNCDTVIYELDQEANTWQQIESDAIRAGDILLFAQNVEGDCVWIVRISAPDEESAGSGAGEATPEQGGSTGGGSGGSSGGSWGGMTGGTGSQTTETVTLYSLERNVLLSVTPQESMTISISVDESDILRLWLGQEAEVIVDALRNEVYTAHITEIGDQGESSGGSSKFTVTLTIDRAEQMLDGMNATVTLSMEDGQSGVCIPVEALNESGSTTFVYTGYDRESNTLLNPVTVETGLSDGERVLILSGLSEGDTFWYAYYDTLDISTAQAESGGFQMFGK